MHNRSVQNGYLFFVCAGLDTVMRAWFDCDALAMEMGLADDQWLLLSQTVGREKT